METEALLRLKTKYDIVGNDPQLNGALERAVAAAPTDLTVLICGESGVGKEVLPKIIHDNSRRRTSGKYLAINCGGLPEGTINSELFGHEKGAYTGATETRKGYFEEANGGTLFLDEVGELPASTQAMLLRVLQNGEFLKVGSSKVEKTDVRIVAATNVNLMYAVSQGKFREDLYYRLNAVQIEMPSLRDRKDDIYLLFRKFSSDFAEKYSLTKISLSHDAILALQSYRWPGNIRQLKNVAESVCAMESGPSSVFRERCEINASTLLKYMPKEELGRVPVVFDSSRVSSMSDDDRQMIIKALIDIKQDVDKLKAVVYGSNFSVPRIEGENKSVGNSSKEREDDEAEWQETESTEKKEESLSLQESEMNNIKKALERFGGNRALAAKELGISERTLYRRLSKNDNL